MSLRVLAVCLVAAVSLSGCSVEFLGASNCGTHSIGPGGRILKEDAWNRDNVLEVAKPGAHIRIEAAGARTVQAEGTGRASLTIPDGTWTVRYFIDGSRCDSFDNVRIDTEPPSLAGLEDVAEAPTGSYTIGSGVTVTGHSTLVVVDLRDGRTLGDSLPVRVDGLPSGLHSFLVSARDAAGNYQNVTVQVRVGDAVDLPKGRFDYGVVARYTNRVRLWDISKPEAYLGIAEARGRAGPEYLAAGFGIAPDDPAVRDVVAEVVRPGMNTMQAAIALYRWFGDNLEYDETRLESETLLTPRQVLLDREDPAGRDCDRAGDANCDGLVDDGTGNGVRGGICRDLAATFVSLLRSAGIPARLVSGYVGGNVNGFHAWVEFYAGAVDGQSPWVPVDVSSIDGPYRPDDLLQSFGIQRPEYLPLRQVPPGGETQGWSTALSVHYTWPQGEPSTPVIRFGKDVSVDTEFTVQGVLCVNSSTLARLVADSTESCRLPKYGQAFNDFVRQTQRTIDYGIEVVSAPRGTEVHAQVAYPFPDDVLPNTVEHLFYGPSFKPDPATGKASATWYPRGR